MTSHRVYRFYNLCQIFVGELLGEWYVVGNVRHWRIVFFVKLVGKCTGFSFAVVCLYVQLAAIYEVVDCSIEMSGCIGIYRYGIVVLHIVYLHIGIL